METSSTTLNDKIIGYFQTKLEKSDNLVEKEKIIKQIAMLQDTQAIYTLVRSCHSQSIKN